MIKKIILASLVSLVVFLTNNNSVFASSYDVYVDADNSGDEDGSSEKPYNTIKEALEKKGSSAKIYVKDGNYSDKITLGKNLELYGESKSVVINGSVTMGSGSLIKNLTVSASGSGVISEKDAKITIENCEIKNSTDIGINMIEGNGKLVLKNSKVYKNRKGLYIQRGNQVEITGSDIYDNKEEGIDLRAKVDGKISGNNIYGNKESGIEIVVGSSEISISGNNIKNNSASGIAAQFYSENKKIGQMKVQNNKITKNSSYGFNCKAPSGGKIPQGYWKDSIELENNTIDNNKGPAIANSCKLIEATDEEEEKDNTIIEDPAAKEEEKAKQEAQKLGEELKQREETAKMEQINQEIEVKKEKTEVTDQSFALIKNLSIRSEEAKNVSSVRKIFFGVDQKNLQSINEGITEMDDLIGKLSMAKEKAPTEETKAEIDLEIQELEKKKTEFKTTVSEYDGKIGIWGWIKNLFS